MKRIPYVKRPFEINDFRGLLEKAYKYYGESPAFMVKPKHGAPYFPVSYSRFRRDVVSFATALNGLGLEGQKIALIGENRYEWAVTYMAVTCGVGVIVPLDKDLPAHEIENLLQESEACAIVYSGKKRDAIAEIKDNLLAVKYFIDMDSKPMAQTTMEYSFEALVENGNELVTQGDQSYFMHQVNREEMRILLYTSGTTGHAKGVMLSHKNICANIMDMAKMIYTYPADKFLSFLPLHHTYECTCGFLCPIYLGTPIVYCEGIRYIASNLKESKASIMLGVPLLFENMYQKIWKQAEKTNSAWKLRMAISVNNFLKIFGLDLSKVLFKQIYSTIGDNVRLFISGAAGIDPKVSKGFRDLGILLIQGYGLTECSPIVTVNRDVDFKDESAGLPLRTTKIDIIHPNAEGIGEIICRGDSIMLGYYNKPEQTEEVLHDGWFHTGDLGFIDDDDFLHITGRMKSVIVTKNGKNIFPEEVETYLKRSPFIEEALVYGVENEEDGETYVFAQIYPSFGTVEEHLGKEYEDDALRELIQTEIKAINNYMTNYKRVSDFKVRKEDFIKTTTQKIKRFEEANRN